MIITVWLLSAFISIPPLLGWKQVILKRQFRIFDKQLIYQLNNEYVS